MSKLSEEIKALCEAWTGNGNDNIVCDGHDIQIGGVQ